MLCKFEGCNRSERVPASLLRRFPLVLIVAALQLQPAAAQAIDGNGAVEKAALPQAAGRPSDHAAAQEGPIPFKQDDAGGIGTGLATGTAACLLLLGVWGALQYRAKQGQVGRPGKPLRIPGLGRFVTPARARSLRVLESAPLTAQARLHVVRWGDKEYLISTSADAVRVLDRGVAHGANAVEPQTAGPGEGAA